MTPNTVNASRVFSPDFFLSLDRNETHITKHFNDTQMFITNYDLSGNNLTVQNVKNELLNGGFG